MGGSSVCASTKHTQQGQEEAQQETGRCRGWGFQEKGLSAGGFGQLYSNGGMGSGRQPGNNVNARADRKIQFGPCFQKRRCFRRRQAELGKRALYKGGGHRPPYTSLHTIP